MRVPGARRWTGARVAHAVGDLTRSAAFYGGLLGLPTRGGFAGHEGHDGRFFALPGGGELELTTGPPAAPAEEDLLVLYLRTPREVEEVAAYLDAAGVPGVQAANPYWNRWGRSFLDPDGRVVVVAAADPPAAQGRRWSWLRIRWFDRSVAHHRADGP